MNETPSVNATETGPSEHDGLTVQASVWYADPKNGLYSDPCLVGDDFTSVGNVTLVPFPDNADRATWRFNDQVQVWEDVSVEVQKAMAEAAEQARVQAEQEKTTAQQTVTLQQTQLKQVGEVLTTASGIISSPAVASTITDEQAVALVDLWPTWAVGTTYSKGQVVIYDGKQYRHHADGTEAATDQLNPKAANYLWTPITITTSGDVEWTQPTGYENAYPKDAVVLYSDGKYYKSLIAGNTQVPGADSAARYWQIVNQDGSPLTTEAEAK